MTPILYSQTRSKMLVQISGNDSARACNTRRMLDQVLLDEITDPLKAARWLGYAICLLELECGLSNEVTRAWVREDVRIKEYADMFAE